MVLGGRSLGWLLVLAGLAVLWFFRSPPRPCDAPEGSLRAPVDGRISRVGPPTGEGLGKATGLQISLAPIATGVRVQRAMVRGCLVRSEVVVGAGKGLIDRLLSRLGLDRRSALTREWTVGESWAMVVEHTCRARRLAQRGPKARELMHQGQRLGPVWPGARLEIYLPEGARPLVVAGDVVRAGRSELAHLAMAGPGRPAVGGRIQE
jgi:phosphatidylserine decarboxylase